MDDWKPIPGYESLYLLSPDGAVWSIPRDQPMPNGGFRKAGGGLLTPVEMKGYLSVDLWREGRLKRRPIHQLVLENFVGLRPKGFAGCHNDGNRKNNHFSNLRWDTYKANSADMQIHGTQWRGSKHHSARLKENDLPVIRKLLSEGVMQKDVAAMYGISQSAVSKINRKASWRVL